MRKFASNRSDHRTAQGVDENQRDVIWVIDDADQERIGMLVAMGWKIVSRDAFGRLERVELEWRPREFDTSPYVQPRDDSRPRQGHHNNTRFWARVAAEAGRR